MQPILPESTLYSALYESAAPSAFFEELRSTGILSQCFPEIHALIGIQQNPVHHPEGDVWTHTMLVLDAAAERRSSAQQPFGFMLAALMHDLGKAVSTEEIHGVIHAYGHEESGLPIAEGLLNRLGIDENTSGYVLNLVALHMKPNMMAKMHSSIKSTNHLFDDSIVPEDLLLLAESDHYGRTDIPDYTEHAEFLKDRLAIYYEIMERPFLTDADILAMGCHESQLAEVSAYAHKLRLACVSIDHAIPQVRSMIKK